MANPEEIEWEFKGNGRWWHPVYGKVFLNEDYGRTFRASPTGWGRDSLTSPAGSFTRFRSKESAMAALVKFHASKQADPFRKSYGEVDMAKVSEALKIMK